MKSEKLVNYWEKIRKLRELKGYTRRQLAEIIGISEATIQRWEKNISCPKLPTLKMLTEVFGVSIKFLMGKTDIFIATNTLDSKLKRLPDEAKEELSIVLDYLIGKYTKRKK